MITEIIKNSVEKSFSYAEFMDLMTELVAEKRTTGGDQSEAMVQFTQLNHQRMKRLDKTLSLSEDEKKSIERNQQKQLWIVITEAWCGDASQIVPVLNKIAQSNANIDLKLVLRDENEALMNEFLTNGGKAVPMLIIANPDTFEVQHRWGPRPKPATALVEECKQKYGKFTSECKEELQKWYNQDKGKSIVNELISILQQ